MIELSDGKAKKGDIIWIVCDGKVREKKILSIIITSSDETIVMFRGYHFTKAQMKTHAFIDKRKAEIVHKLGWRK